MYQITRLLCLCVLLLIAGVAMATETRSPFLLSVGLGLNATSVDAGSNHWYDYGSTLGEGTGGAFDFKLGVFATPQIPIFYTLKVTAYDQNDGNGYWQPYHTVFSGVGASYYFSPTNPSFYLTGGVGATQWGVSDSSSIDTTGAGGFVGLGYAFSKHFAIEGIIMGGESSDSYYYDTPYSRFTTTMITLNAML